MRSHAHSSIATGLIALTAAVPVAAAAEHAQSPPNDRSAVVIEVRDRGFHWGDAAIGAAGALGLVLTAGGLVVVARPSWTGASHRKRHA